MIGSKLITKKNSPTYCFSKLPNSRIYNEDDHTNQTPTKKKFNNKSHEPIFSSFDQNCPDKKN